MGKGQSRGHTKRVRVPRGWVAPGHTSRPQHSFQGVPTVSILPGQPLGSVRPGIQRPPRDPRADSRECGRAQCRSVNPGSGLGVGIGTGMGVGPCRCRCHAQGHHTGPHLRQLGMRLRSRPPRGQGSSGRPPPSPGLPCRARSTPRARRMECPLTLRWRMGWGWGWRTGWGAGPRDRFWGWVGT